MIMMIMPKPARDREETSDRRAKVLALAVLGWSFSEIGTRLRIAESTSGRRLNKARAVDTTPEEQKAVRGTRVGGGLSLNHIDAWRG